MSQQAEVFKRRRGGVLLHLTSLPSGTIGQDAYRFIDFLHQSGMTLWQMLPLGPTHDDGSPYQCLSAFAVDRRFICKHTVSAQDWAYELDINVNDNTFYRNAYQLFEQQADNRQKHAFQDFCEQQTWLKDYALFCLIRTQTQSLAWTEWPAPLRDRDPATLAEAQQTHRAALQQTCFEQFLFWQQWQALKQYAASKGVLLFGDMPIFVAHDSADVWVDRALFMLDEQGRSTHVAGVPPDYFSETGQRWGNPLYQWTIHEQQDFSWWKQRLASQLDLFDMIRIDHFRGFEAFWQIPAQCETAIEGQWITGPGEKLFDSLVAEFGELPFVAEDLGIITEQVNALRQRYALPGMKILQFAFGGEADNPYLPHQHEQNSVVYTGTHDNDTTVGWYQNTEPHVHWHIEDYSGMPMADLPWPIIKMAWQSVAQLAVIPMQDVLALDSEHRMNTPGTTEGNWTWQLDWQSLSEQHGQKLKHLNQLYGR